MWLPQIKPLYHIKVLVLRCVMNVCLCSKNPHLCVYSKTNRTLLQKLEHKSVTLSFGKFVINDVFMVQMILNDVTRCIK